MKKALCLCVMILVLACGARASVEEALENVRAENGLLPESSDMRVNEFLENLVASGVENSPLPKCNPDYWHKLNLWLNRIIDYHELRR